jgi:hypothetical protein
MAAWVQVQVLDGKENTVDETRVTYRVGIPSDVLFYTQGGIRYAQFWNTNVPAGLISIPVSQIVSID